MASKRQTLDTLANILEQLKAEGADYAEVNYSESSSLSIGVRNGKVESLERAPTDSNISFTVRIGDKIASDSPNTKRPEFLKDSMRGVIAAARLKTDNPDQALPDRSLLAKIKNNRSLDQYDKTKPSADELITDLLIAESAARSVKHIKDIDSANGQWITSQVTSMSSHGDVFENKRSRNSLGISVLAEDGGPLSTDGEYSQARYRADVRDPATIGRLAAERAVASLNPKKAPAGNYPVIFDPDMAAGLLQHFAQAASGSSIFMKQSLLNRDSLETQVLASGITIVNDPHKLRGLASSMYTSSGLPTKRTVIAENGTLKAFFLGLESARRLGLPLTDIRGEPGTLTIEAGSVTKQSLLAGVKEGFYVTGVMGQGVNIASGNYSRGASGFWIENGVLTYAVAEATIAGNLRDMFMNAIAADDLDTRERKIAAPTLRIDGMTIA